MYGIVAHGTRGGKAQKEAGPKQSRRSLFDYLNSPFGLTLLSGLILTGLGGLYTTIHQSEISKKNGISSARNLLSESRFRLNEVRSKTNDLEYVPDVEKKQMFTQFIFAIAVGSEVYRPALPEFKDTHWAGILIRLNSIEHVVGFDNAMRSTQDLESGFYNKGLNYFDSQFLEQRIKLLDEYQDRVEAKIDQDEESRSWLERKLF